jgi:hypothetical protein
VPDRDPLISTVQFREPFPTFATRRSPLCAFNRDNDFASFSQRSLQDPNIGYIQRNGHLCFAHVFPTNQSFFAPDFIAFDTPISAGYHGNSY